MSCWAYAKHLVIAIIENELVVKELERHPLGKWVKLRSHNKEYSGIVHGLKDGGIDLRAFREGRMIAAQCKFWERKRKIRSNTISQFIGDLDREIDEHPNLQVIGLFCCKNDNFDTGCKERLQSKGIWIHIKNYDNKYPCVKCIATSGLYYVPQHRDYDAIAFSIHRGDRHCYDEAEAERLGFREAV